MDDQSVSRFWDNYVNKLKCYDANPDARRWYVQHVRQYI